MGFIPGLNDILGLLGGQNPTPYVLQDGDSGGPLFSQTNYVDDTVCGINSARMPSFDCNPVFAGFPLPVRCDATWENHYARVDSSDAAKWIRAHIKDKLGRFKGTCNGEGPASLQNTDTDKDGIPDACDPCPYVADANYIPNGDYSDEFKTDLAHDYDQDGVPDVCDNCPTVKNPYVFDNGTMVQTDTDKDGVGDACDSCPYSDVRRAHVKQYAGDFKCCTTDADCGNADHVGRKYNVKTANLCMPIDYASAGLDADMSWPPPSDVPHCASGKHCANGSDSDGDTVSDSCDNCPGTPNSPDKFLGTQSDLDHDGVGDECDNCDGGGPDFPGDDRTADKNDGPDALALYYMECSSDADCLLPNVVGKCVPAPITLDAAGNPNYGTRVCTKFPDFDNDGIGDACDNCPTVANAGGPGTDGYIPGSLNGQANCNLLAEYSGGVKYPYHGDACDPNPCNRTGWNRALLSDKNYSSLSGNDLWVTISYDPQILPKGDKRYDYDPALESSFKSYSGTPTATVGSQTCDCGGANGVLWNPLECSQSGRCPVNPRQALYRQPPWRNLETPPTFSTTLASTAPENHPDSSYFDKKALVPGLPMERAAGAPTQLGDNLAEFRKAPSYVSWDLTQSGATVHGLLGYGLTGVYWTSVRSVTSMEASADTFRNWASHYESGFLGKTRDVLGLTKAVCPLCNLDDCEVCLQRICKACLTSPDFKSLVTSPETRQVFAQSSLGAVDITGEFSSEAIQAIFEPGARWVTAAERAGWIGSSGIAFATISSDGTTVESTLVAGEQGVTVLGATQIFPGGGLLGAPVRGAIPLQNSASSPAPRSDFGAVLSASRRALYVIGGRLQSGNFATDLWKYSVTAQAWTEMFFSGPAPEKVIAATYLPDTESLWVVDQTDENLELARLLRYDFATRTFHLIGKWPRTLIVDRVELSGAAAGDLLLSGSSTQIRHVAGVVLRPDGDTVSVVGAFLRKGVLAVEPTLGPTALTLPLVSTSSTGSQNVTIPLSDVFFPTHEPPSHSPQGPPCNDYRCPQPPHLQISDVL